MKFQEDISNMNTYVRTDKPKPICPPPLFQSWGHNKKGGGECRCRGLDLTQNHLKMEKKTKIRAVA